MKILIIDNASMTFFKGKHLTNSLNGLFLDELMECGNSVSYFQFSSPSESTINSYVLEDHGIKCIPMKYCKTKIWRYLRAYCSFIFIARKYDFIYFYYPNTFRYLGFVCNFLKIPFGLYIRGMHGLRGKVANRIFRIASVVNTEANSFSNLVNSVVKKDLAKTIKPMIPYSDADVIENRDYKLSDEIKLLFLGRVSEDKGVRELIMATERLKDDGIKVKLKIVGSGEFLNDAKSLVEQEGLDDIVSLEGPVYDNEKKKRYYLDADVYILPTYHEGFPRTLHESMIFGTPVITTFVGGIPDLMVENHNCIRIVPKSINSIVDAVKYSIKNYDQLIKCAHNASSLEKTIMNRSRMSHAQQLNESIINELS